MNTVATASLLLSREIVSSAGSRLRQLGFLQLILVVVFVLLMVPVSYRFLRVGGVESAAYDYSVSGDLTVQDLDGLRSAGSRTVAAASIWGIEVCAGGASVAADAYFVDDMAAASRMLPLNAALLSRGAFSDDSAVITADVARSLHAVVGDDVTIRWTGYAETPRELRMKVGGIAYSTASGSMVVAPESAAEGVVADIRDSLVSQGQSAPAYTIAYVAGPKGEAAQPAEAAALMGDRIALETRQARLASEEREVQRLQGGQMRVVLIGSAVLYLFLLLQYMNHRVTQNGKLYAILTAVGARPAVIRTHFLCDAIMTIAILSVIGLAAASMLYRVILHMYMPLDRMAQVAVPAIAANMLLAFVGVVVGMKRMSRVPLAVVLSGE